MAGVPEPEKSTKSPRKRTPTKAERAAEIAVENTLPISHYFSPSSQNSNGTPLKRYPQHQHTSQQINAVSLETGDSTMSIDSSPLSSSKKRRNPNASIEMSSANKRRKEGFIKMPAEECAGTKHMAFCKSAKKLDFYKHEQSSLRASSEVAITLDDSSDSDDDILVFSPFSKRLIDLPTTQNMQPVSEVAERVKTEEKCGHNSRLNEKRFNASVASKIKLGLVRVRVGMQEDISEIVENLEVDANECTVYPVFDGALLGRDDHRRRMNKASIGIPSCETCISRKQLQVVSILPPLDPTSVFCSAPYDHLFNALSFLQHQQRSCPRIEIRSCEGIVNEASICRLHINHEHWGKILRGENSNCDRHILEIKRSLGRGDNIVLRVGDMIDFDSHNHSKAAGSSLSTSIDGELCVPRNSISKRNYVYRLVSYISKNEQSVVAENPAETLEGSPMSEERGVTPSVIMPTVANACLRTFNSSECDEGFGALMHLDSTWRFTTNMKLHNFLLSFMICSPQHEGHQMSSQLRTELAFKYMKRVQCRSCDNEDMHPTFVELKQILNLPTRNDAQSLHFFSQSISCLAEIISFGLQDILNGNIKASTEMFNNRIPFIRHFIGCNIREGLKTATTIAVVTLLRHGYLLFGIHGENQTIHKSIEEQICANEMYSLVSAYGTIVSNLAFIFCVEEGARCCFVIRNALECELDKTDFLKLRGVGAAGKKRITKDAINALKRQIKLRFIFSLSTFTEFSRDLQRQLSRHFDLEREVSIVLD